MADFNELKETVKKRGFGSSQYRNINGDIIYLSTGIKEIFLTDAEAAQKITDMVTRFQNADFGNAVQYGKESRPGHEYGRYECEEFDACEEDTAVWAHRAEDVIKLYFKFER